MANFTRREHHKNSTSASLCIDYVLKLCVLQTLLRKSKPPNNAAFARFLISNPRPLTNRNTSHRFSPGNHPPSLHRHICRLLSSGVLRTSPRNGLLVAVPRNLVSFLGGRGGVAPPTVRANYLREPNVRITPVKNTTKPHIKWSPESMGRGIIDADSVIILIPTPPKRERMRPNTFFIANISLSLQIL